MVEAWLTGNIELGWKDKDMTDNGGNLNEKNLFEIMNTDQLFFKYYGQKELYVIGVTSDYDAAVSVVEQILCEGYAASEEFSPKQIFEKKDFSR